MRLLPAPAEPGAVDEAPAERREPQFRTVALILAMKIAGIGRGGLAREIAEELDVAAQDMPVLAEEYRYAASLIRTELREWK